MNALEAGRQFLAAWEERRPDKAAALFTEDGIFFNPLHPAPIAGRSAILATVTRGMSVLRDVTCDVNFEIDKGSTAAMGGFFRSERSDTGGRFDFAFAILIEMRGTEMMVLREYFDTATLR